ncbi:TPA: glycosyltransferase, partial [Escherichia coli]
MSDIKLNIEIGLSALNSGIYKIKFRNDYNYLIIHQITDECDYSDYVASFPENVRYISSYESGLSKSRNMAIENAKYDYLWLMDDDMEIDDAAWDYLTKFISDYKNSPLLVVSHSLAKKYNNEKERIKRLNPITAAGICSVDMILKISALDGIRFNSDFGLGAKYPSGEEYIFACDLMRAGKKIYKSNKICSNHPDTTSSDKTYPNKDAFSTKKKMFKVANGKYLGSILYIAFVVKKLLY